MVLFAVSEKDGNSQRAKLTYLRSHILSIIREMKFPMSDPSEDWPFGPILCGTHKL